MLQDIGPLQIEQKYVGRNVIGTQTKRAAEDAGGIFTGIVIMIALICRAFVKKN